MQHWCNGSALVCHTGCRGSIPLCCLILHLSTDLGKINIKIYNKNLYMSRYRGPRLRILKRLGSLPGFGYKLNQKFLEQKKDSRNENSSQTSAKKKKKKIRL